MPPKTEYVPAVLLQIKAALGAAKPGSWRERVALRRTMKIYRLLAEHTATLPVPHRFVNPFADQERT